MKKFLKAYNTAETVLVLTSFPTPAKKASKTKKLENAVGVSWHSQKTLLDLARTQKVLVLAEEDGKERHLNPAKNLQIVRIWRKGNVLSFMRLYTFITSLTNVQRIFVQFEFNVFGGILPIFAVLSILGLLRLQGKQVTFELHQVVTDIGTLRKHLYVNQRIVHLLYNMGLALFYKQLGLISNDIVVFEEALKKRLSPFVSAKKVHVLSLAAEKAKKVTRKKARKQIGLPDDAFVVLVFGFINGYKGLDWIVDALSKKPHKKVILMIAGGQSPFLKNNPSYQKFYHTLIDKIKPHKHMVYTGFIPDENVPSVYAAADITVLPYEVFMSSSGPFSLALSYQKPVILSDVLQSYQDSHDFTLAMQRAGITSHDLFFPLKKHAFRNRVRRLATDKKQMRKLTKFSQELAELRSNDSVTKRLRTLLFSSPTQNKLSPAIQL